MTVPMAIVDFIPVVLFLIATLILMRDLYHMMSKGAFALMCAGFIMITMAGIYKAAWKLLVALDICDFVALNNAFFPMQATGFVLAALGLVSLLSHPQGKLNAIAYTSNMPFVILLVLGTAGVWGSLGVIAQKMNKKGCTVMLAVSFGCMLMMGYLSSRDFTQAIFNWIGEGVNLLGELLLLLSVLAMHKGGLDTFDLKGE